MIQITVQSTSGTVYGAGPIITALNVEYTAVLDGAGDWSINVPASDTAVVTNVAIDRILVATMLTKSGTRTLFRGPVRDIKLAISNGELVYNLRGEDELGLLSEVLVWDTYEQVTWDTPLRVERLSGSIVDVPEVYDGDTGTFYDFKWTNLASEYFVYVRFYAQMDGLRFDMGTAPNQATADLTVQYFNGAGWDNVTGLSDGTAVGGATLAQDGDVTWTRPDDEAEAYHNTQLGYWARLHVDNDLDSDTGTAGQQDIRVNEIYVRYVAPETDEISDLLTTHGPASWDTNGTYYDGTADGTLDKFEGESLLEILGRIAKRSGEHFRASTTSKRVDWLRTTTPDSGLVAVASNHERVHDKNACVIEKIDIEAHNDRVTRVYAFAAGGSDAATDLSEASGVTLPSGYTLETDAGGRYYIKNGTLETSIGRPIMRRLDIPDIVPMYGTGQNKRTSEALARATVAYMEQRNQIQYVYRVRLSNVTGDLRPGDTIRLIYQGATSDGTRVIALNSSLIVLRMTVQVSREGAMYDLLLSNVSRLPASDETILAEIIQQMRAMKRRPQPLSGTAVSGLQSGIPQ